MGAVDGRGSAQVMTVNFARWVPQICFSKTPFFRHYKRHAVNWGGMPPGLPPRLVREKNSFLPRQRRVPKVIP
jgi:hypothetical protein